MLHTLSFTSTTLPAPHSSSNARDHVWRLYVDVYYVDVYLLACALAVRVRTCKCAHGGGGRERVHMASLLGIHKPTRAGAQMDEPERQAVPGRQ